MSLTMPALHVSHAEMTGWDDAEKPQKTDTKPTKNDLPATDWGRPSRSTVGLLAVGIIIGFMALRYF